MLPQEQQSTLRLTRQLRSEESLSKASADTLVRAVVHAWQEIRFPALLERGLRRVPSHAHQPKVRRLATYLSELPLFDATFWLSSAYAQWVGEARRNEAAMFFTPPVLADRLIGDLCAAGADFLTANWADPACGGAAFLAPIAHRMAERLRKEGTAPLAILESIKGRIRGNDADAMLVELSRQFLRMALYPEISASRHEPNWAIEIGNALTSLKAWNGSVDVVVCNPPYRKMQTAEMERYRAQYGRVIYGQPNLYALFLSRAVDLLTTTGLAGFITPTSFLSGQSFSKLRTYLLKDAELRQLSIVNKREGVFVSVEQEVALSILQHQVNPSTTGKSARVFVYQHDKRYVDIGFCALPNPGEAWPIPRTGHQVAAMRVAGGSPFRLSDYGYVPRIGWFVDYRQRFTFRPLGRVPKKPLRGKKYLPLIWSSDISPAGRFTANRNNDNGHKGILELPEDHVSGIHTRPAVALQRVTSHDQPRRLVGAALPAPLMKRGVVAENHVILLEQVDANNGFSPNEIAALLRTPTVDGYFRCISGAVNVSVYELQQLPLPEPAELRRQLDAGVPMAEAVRLAFGATKG